MKMNAWQRIKLWKNKMQGTAGKCHETTDDMARGFFAIVNQIGEALFLNLFASRCLLSLDLFSISMALLFT